MRGVSMLSKAPGGRLGILGMYSEGRPARGSVVHEWLHTVKHTQTLNFDLNFRVLGGFCGSIGVKQGVLPVVIATQKWLMGLTKTPVSVIETISTLSAESQIVVTCEKFNRKFWRVFQGNSRFKV